MSAAHPPDWPSRLGLARLSVAALLSLAPVAARAAESPPAQQATQTSHDEVDAEILRDLEVLNNPNHARDREIARRLGFFERMRLLDWMTRNAPVRDGATPPGERAQKEVK